MHDNFQKVAVAMVIDKKPGRGSDQFPLRLPEGMRDELKAMAELNGRSMNAEIIVRLEQSLALPPLNIPVDLLARVRHADATTRASSAQMLVDDLSDHFPVPAPPKRVINFTTRQMVESLEKSVTKTKELVAFLDHLKEQMAAGEIDGDAPAQFSVPLNYDADGKKP